MKPRRLSAEERALVEGFRRLPEARRAGLLCQIADTLTVYRLAHGAMKGMQP